MSISRNPKYWKHKAWGAERLYQLSRWLWVHRFCRLSLICKYINVLAFRCYIDPQANIGPRLDLPHSGFGLVIGASAEIGSDAIIFHGVTVGSAQPGPITIGDRIYIGTGATILGPIRIGADVRIGAGAVVVGSDIPDGATVVAPRSRVVLATARTAIDGADTFSRLP
jgi:serine O-acetyltransferase